MIKLGNQLSISACKVLLLYSNKDLRDTFSRKDAEIFRKVADRIGAAHRQRKEKEGN